MYCHARNVEVVNPTLLVPGTHPFLDAVEPAIIHNHHIMHVVVICML